MSKPKTQGKPSISEVLDMPAKERYKWSRQWTLAERRQAQAIAMRKLSRDSGMYKGYLSGPPLRGEDNAY